MTPNEPKRLLEQPGSDLDVLLLESALDEPPPARAVERTLVALGVASAATGLCAGAASTAAVKTGLTSGVGGVGWLSSLSLLTKVGVGLAVVATSVGVPYALLRSPEPAPQVASVVATPRLGGGAAAEGADAQPAVVVDAVVGAAERDGPRGTPAAEVAERDPAAVAQDSRAPSTSTASAKRPSPSASSGATAKASSPSSLSEEVKLLDAARSALRRGDHAARLALLDTYASRFPNGQLKAEAQSMRQVAAR